MLDLKYGSRNSFLNDHNYDAWHEELDNKILKKIK